jgi:molybdenum cofactor cytidylyltransferase
MTRIGGIILAAGASTRFGAKKLIAPLEGRPLLQHVIDVAESSDLDPLVVVLGHASDAIYAALELGRATAVVNSEWVTGQASSLRAGLRALGEVDAVVVLLGDQPRVSRALIDALVVARRARRAVAAISTSSGRRSPPTLLGSELFADVEALTGDTGARALLAGRDDVIEVDAADALPSLADVDRPEDLLDLGG